MRHQVDLSIDRVRSPDDNQVGLGKFTGIAAALGTDTGRHPGQHDRRADRVMLARISHGVAQALNPVALYLAHGAGIIIQPDRFRSVLLRGGLEFLGNDIERLIPRDRLEIIQGRYCGFGPLAAQAAVSGGRDDAPARRNVRPSRRPRPPYSYSPPNHAPGRFYEAISSSISSVQALAQSCGQTE